MSEGVTAEVEILNELGLHARPASQVATVANRYPCEVWLAKDGVSVNAKSVMGLLMLAASRGNRLTLRCAGDQESVAMDALTALFASGFEEASP